MYEIKWFSVVDFCFICTWDFKFEMWVLKVKSQNIMCNQNIFKKSYEIWVYSKVRIWIWAMINP